MEKDWKQEEGDDPTEQTEELRLNAPKKCEITRRTKDVFKILNTKGCLAQISLSQRLEVGVRSGEEARSRTFGSERSKFRKGQAQEMAN